MSKLLKRSELKVDETWDLTRLFKTEADYEKAVENLVSLVAKFEHDFKDKMIDAKTINLAIDAYKDVMMQFSYVGYYASLSLSTDQTNQQNVMRASKYRISSATLGKQLTFFSSQLEALDPKILKEAKSLSEQNACFIDEIIKFTTRRLSQDVELALAEFSQVFSAHYNNYNVVKLTDINFGAFTLDDNDYPMSFSNFENDYAHDQNTEKRRAAYKHFYANLGKYENGLAANYYAHLLKEKGFANLKKHDSVFDYLLFGQDIEKSIYDRQIDYLMDNLSIPFRKFALLLKQANKLDKLTYADLLISLDYEYEPSISIEKSMQYSIDGLKLLGADYGEMIKCAFSQRWIDFPQNIGKSTGGFCSSPYRRGSYILLNWNNRMDEVFVLVHELGHAGHFHYASLAQNILNTRPSLFIIEAPSTMNELVMGDYLKTQSDDLRFKRWVLSSLLSRTYYHNCVTHLLEAHFQREVYRLIDAKQPLSAQILNNLKLASIKKFWGDTVQVDEYAGKTWMRQPHYFMGLYPYTYSAGLTIATNAFAMIKDGKLKVDDWLNLLKAGGTKKPLELAKMVKVDYNSDQPLKNMVDFVQSMVDEVEVLTKKL